jgi:lipid-A-disaccharide synthase
MKYYFVAGEASGDLHAAKVIRELKKIDSQADFRCFGGDLMQEQGATIVKHYKDMAFMGLIEVIQNLGTIKKNLKLCKSDILSYKPNTIVLVDYPGFNFRIAEFAKKNGIKVCYYISPKVWAWKEGRVKKLKKFVDKLFVIFPFEVDYFKKHNLKVDFVGNPLVDEVEEKKQTSISKSEFISKHNLSEKPIIALMPGSRKQELLKILPPMLALIPYFPNYQFVIAGTPALSESLYKEIIGKSEAQLLFNCNSELLQNAEAGLIASGTATLETALYNLPQVVCYKANALTMAIGQAIVNLEYVSLVNLIMGRELVKELIQNDMTLETMKTELQAVLMGGNKRTKMLEDYKLLVEKIGGVGASKKTATLIYEFVS